MFRILTQGTCTWLAWSTYGGRCSWGYHVISQTYSGIFFLLITWTSIGRRTCSMLENTCAQISGAFALFAVLYTVGGILSVLCSSRRWTDNERSGEHGTSLNLDSCIFGFWRLCHVISAKNHKHQRRKRQSVTAKREKVANVKVRYHYTNLTQPDLI